MRALLPFDWSRLSKDARLALTSHRQQFLCVPLLASATRQVAEPAMPDYLLFTSQRGVQAALVQPWFQGPWCALPAYAVGGKTAAAVASAGLQLARQVAPPAPQILPLLPADLGSGLASGSGLVSGLWLAGQVVAHDLPAQAGGLVHLPLYEMQVDLAQRQRVSAALRLGDLDAALVTSVQVVEALATFACASQLRYFVVLSQRLASAAQTFFPSAQIEQCPNLETAVLVLQKRLQTHR